MYSPPHHRQENWSEIKSFIHQNGFAILVNQMAGRPWATHLPLELAQDADGHEVLHGHLARANPQWRHLAENPGVMAIFAGPHAYISSSWYDHENVPTWNYQAVHVYGQVRLIEGEELYQTLKRLVDKYEAGSAQPVAVETMSPDFFQREVRGLVGLEIRVDEVQAVDKLSQNRDDKNHARIVGALQNRTDAASHQVAAAMLATRKK
jgi:transcriptional regulator